MNMKNLNCQRWSLPSRWEHLLYHLINWIFGWLMFPFQPLAHQISSIPALPFFLIFSEKIIHNQNLCVQAPDLFSIRNMNYHIINIWIYEQKHFLKKNALQTERCGWLLLLVTSINIINWFTTEITRDVKQNEYCSMKSGNSSYFVSFQLQI